MKTFLFSVCALALLIGVIFINAAYVGRVTNDMQNDLKNLPACAQASEQAEKLLARWKSEEKLLALSVSATDMNELGNHLTELGAAARLNDEEAFERARALCLLGLARIQDLERVSFLHIL